MPPRAFPFDAGRGGDRGRGGERGRGRGGDRGGGRGSERGGGRGGSDRGDSRGRGNLGGRGRGGPGGWGPGGDRGGFRGGGGRGRGRGRGAVVEAGGPIGAGGQPLPIIPQLSAGQTGPLPADHVQAIGVKRQQYGNAGRLIKLRSNHIEIKLNPGTVHHYDGMYLSYSCENR